MKSLTEDDTLKSPFRKLARRQCSRPADLQARRDREFVGDIDSLSG